MGTAGDKDAVALEAAVGNTKKNKAETQNKNTHALLLSPPSNGNKCTKQEFYNLVITHDMTMLL